MEGPALLILNLLSVTCMCRCMNRVLLSSSCLLREYKNTTDVCTSSGSASPYLFLTTERPAAAALLTGSVPDWQPCQGRGRPQREAGVNPSTPSCSASVVLLKFPISQTQPEKLEGLGTRQGGGQEQSRDRGRASALKGGWEDGDSPASPQNALL